MKRKLFAISLVLALLASAYAAYACLSTRGIRVYLMGTRMGAVLAGTWQLALLAAVILWIPAAITLIRKVRGMRRHSPVPTEDQTATEIVADEEDPEATELLEPRGSAREATELLEPRGSAGEATELLGPQESAEKEMGLPKPVKDATDAVFAESPVKRPAAPARGEPSQRFCPNCGHPVSGKRFCARCGAKTGE